MGRQAAGPPRTGSAEAADTERTAEDSRTLGERLRDVLQARGSFSLYIWPPDSKFRCWCREVSGQGWFDFIILVFIAANCITLGTCQCKVRSSVVIPSDGEAHHPSLVN